MVHIFSVSVPYLFCFPRYHAKYVIKFLFKTVDDVINFKIYLGSTPKQWLTWQEEKERKTEIEKFEYLDNNKNFLDEIKNIFIVIEGLIWLKIKIW